MKEEKGLKQLANQKELSDNEEKKRKDAEEETMKTNKKKEEIMKTNKKKEEMMKTNKKKEEIMKTNKKSLLADMKNLRLYLKGKAVKRRVIGFIELKYELMRQSACRFCRKNNLLVFWKSKVSYLLQKVLEVILSNIRRFFESLLACSAQSSAILIRSFLNFFQLRQLGLRKRTKKSQLLDKLAKAFHSARKDYKYLLLLKGVSVMLTYLLLQVSVQAFLRKAHGGNTQRKQRSRTQTSAMMSEISFSETLSRIRLGQVNEVNYFDNSKILIKAKNGNAFFSHIIPGGELLLFSVVNQYVPTFRYVRKMNPTYLLQLVSSLIFLLSWLKIIKSLMNVQNDQYSGTDDSVRTLENITFSDVVSKATDELKDVVDYLNNSKFYENTGVRMPRGILLIGPSGTGKTFLAKAVAGEARVPFISSNASEFIEMYVGRGSSRVRSIFQNARQKSPSVLFIDELDALGSRSNKHFAVHQEYIQTINQLLSELDGFYGRRDGVVVIAATNRYSAIDEALVRSGRFDRHVYVNIPDERERLSILRLHAKKKKMNLDLIDEGVLQCIAKKSYGLTGADLENLLNESIFYSLRKNKQQVDLCDLESAMNTLLARRSAINDFSFTSDSSASSACSSVSFSRFQKKLNLMNEQEKEI